MAVHENLTEELQAIDAELTILEEVVGIDNQEEAIAEAVRRLRTDSEHFTLVNELRILLGAVSDADALRQAINHAKDLNTRASVKASVYQEAQRGSVGY
ncbi:MAG: hypothetical protein Q7S57_04585 [bacterium]|nr:hypothetical protein [bacterium]